MAETSREDNQMNISEIVEILKPENEVESTMVADSEFIEGCSYGKPRSGHPEGKIIFHIYEVLKNVEKYSNPSDRMDLRVIALVHDTFKYQVDRAKPKIGENHHGYFARKFLDKFVSDIGVLEVVELHDEGYNSWCDIKRKGVESANARAIKLADRLSESNSLELYLKFYRCDNETGDKERDNFLWFNQFLREQGYNFD